MLGSLYTQKHIIRILFTFPLCCDWLADSRSISGLVFFALFFFWFVVDEQLTVGVRRCCLLFKNKVLAETIKSFLQRAQNPFCNISEVGYGTSASPQRCLARINMDWGDNGIKEKTSSRRPKEKKTEFFFFNRWRWVTQAKTQTRYACRCRVNSQISAWRYFHEREWLVA